MPNDPIGLSEVAEILSVSRMTASRYAKRKDFPKATVMPRGRIWSRKQVERWATKTLPLHRGGRLPNA
jgi:predicted DNA-binding transcriptional regulator AlpA